MRAAADGLAELRCNGGGQSSDRIEEAVRNPDAVPGRHQDRHGSPPRTTPRSAAASSPFLAAGSSTR